MSGTRSPVIETQDLTKIFKSEDVTAVDNINFKVEKGDVFGFLGPNGAGKTTAIKMLSGALDPTEGSAEIVGYDIVDEPLKVKEKIGVMPEEPGFYGNMTGREHLKFYVEFYDSDKYEENIEKVIEQTNIGDYVDRKVKGYSHGMKKRLALAQSLIHDPEVLILDEPTGGLDPQGTHFFRNFIEKLHEEGKTIFLSSHILSEVQEVCNRVGIINKGEILEVDLIENLSEDIAESKGEYKIKVEAEGINDEIFNEIEDIEGILSLQKTEIGLTAMVNDDDLSTKINSKLMGNGVKVKSINIKEPDLEEIFLNITEGES